MTHSPSHFANRQRLFYELTKPDRRTFPGVKPATRMKAITRGVQARVAKVKANKLFDRLMKKGAV